MRNIFLGLGLLVLSTAGYCQILWQNTKVDMTVSELQAMYPQAVPASGSHANGWQTLLKLPEYEIVRHKFDVQFVFAEENLKMVMLTHKVGDANRAFSELETLLKTRYGNPIESKVDSISKQVVWLSDNGTSITMIICTIGKPLLNIQYKVNDEANKL